MSVFEGQLLRYDDVAAVATHLDPLEDLCSWIVGLRSVGYTGDLLVQKHGMTAAAEIRESSRSIRSHVDVAVAMLDQAHSGPPETAFLPLYYAALNLSKICVIAAGMRKELGLKDHRRHGAAYPPDRNTGRELLTEEIELYRGGALPLFYRVLTGLELPRRRVRMSAVYPFITDVAHEFDQCYGGTRPLCWCQLEMSEVRGGCELSLHLQEDKASTCTPRNLKLLRGNWTVSDRRIALTCQGDPGVARAKLLTRVRRFLIYNAPPVHSERRWFPTPLSSSRLLLPEEVPLWLAFFHLSNVVRYNPVFLERLRDSRCWPLLLCLRRHGAFRMLLLFWSYMHKTSFTITSG